ncbi:MAG TPA: hypothetical protein VNI55_02255 [Gaiellaceae bacterium]|nr:hypothetical protein [Gaiellaceae bacterium]
MGKTLALAASETTIETTNKRVARTDTRKATIRLKWNRRCAIRSFEEGVAERGEINPSEAIGVLLEYGKHAAFDDLVACLPVDCLAPVLARLLRVVELKEMSYPDYLDSPEWRERAAKAKTRYQGRCALDATHFAEDAHHRTYERRGREYDGDLIPLCRVCHSTFHKR